MSSPDNDKECAERCSYCVKTSGGVNLKICSQCRMVRYCSVECQKAAWPIHKAQCKTGEAHQDAQAQNTEMRTLDNDFSKWLDCWRSVISNVSMAGFDLANHPHDRLATHCVYIEVQRRSNPPSFVQSFRMTSAKILSRCEVVNKLRQSNCTTEEQINSWKEDNRGDHTVHTIIRFHDLTRFLRFSLKDLAQFRQDPETSARLAADWDQMLMAVIEHGHRM